MAGAPREAEFATLVTFTGGGALPARTESRGVCRAGFLVVALALCLSGCSLGGGDDEAQDAGGETGVAETGPDSEALRAVWAEEVGAACTERNESIETLARDLPGVVEQEGLVAAAAQFEPINEAMLERMNDAEPAPGDEARAQEMAGFYQEAAQLAVQALGTEYTRRDRGFYALIRQSEAAREEADAIAAELGARDCAVEPAGAYANAAAFAAVRWGDRASKLCRARDRTFARLRPTDTARFEAATRLWLRQMRTLHPPTRYARRIDRFLAQQVASDRAVDAADIAFARGDVAVGEALVEKSNRLSSRSSELMYQVGFEIGFENFCSTGRA